METLAIIATVCGTFISLVWFVREMRKENSQVLKRQEEILIRQQDILVKIEEGQRQGFIKLAE
ncbi:MAG: hypothetical protein ACE5J5_08770, partial [Candidatus Hydrothermarchaeales archaeon]